MIVMAGGAMIAILVAIVVQASMNGANGNAQNEQAEANTVKILVAARDKQLGQRLSGGDLRWQEWPKSAVFDKAIVREDNESASSRLSGRLVRNIVTGRPVLKSAVSRKKGDNILATRMKKGERGVAIEVDAASMAGGFVAPGDSVDVLMTYQMRIRGDNEALFSTLINQYATETVLEDVKVLATDQEAVKEDNEASVARTVTLAVKPKQAEALALAMRMGELHLALRPVGDTERRHADKPADVATKFMNKNAKNMQKHFKGMTTDVRIADVMRSVNAMKNGGGNRSQIMRIYYRNGVSEVSTRQ